MAVSTDNMTLAELATDGRIICFNAVTDICSAGNAVPDTLKPN
jgi:hypothetical protein